MSCAAGARIAGYFLHRLLDDAAALLHGVDPARIHTIAETVI